MIEVLGRVMPGAVSYGINPTPVAALILLLTGPSARRTSMAFLFGWLIGCGGIFAVLAVAGSAWVPKLSHSAEGWLKLALGLLFLALAVFEWRARPTPGKPDPQLALLEKFDGVKPLGAFGMALLMPPTNLKNLSLTVSTSYTVGAAHLGTTGTSVVLGCFVLVGSMSLIVPVVLYMVDRQGAAHLLSAWRDWLVAHNAAILFTVFVILAASSIGSAIEIFAG